MTASEELNTRDLEDEGASVVRHLEVRSTADRPWLTVVKGVRPQSCDKNRNELGRKWSLPAPLDEDPVLQCGDPQSHPVLGL